MHIRVGQYNLLGFELLDRSLKLRFGVMETFPTSEGIRTRVHGDRFMTRKELEEHMRRRELKLKHVLTGGCQ